jgi:Mn-dependent DtxR family transcriptional regulator
MYERHTLLCEFLTAIGVDEQTANDDACKIEHVISDSTFEAIKKYALERRG